MNLIELLLSISKLKGDATVLDVGCGIGGTTRYLARHLGCAVTGITISGRQVAIANSLTAEEEGTSPPLPSSTTTTRANDDVLADFQSLGANNGKVQFLELDAEKMESRFEPASFDVVWISEALSHFPDKPLFFRNAARVLKSEGGKLIIADWFKVDDATLAEIQGGEADIKLIEGLSQLVPPPSHPPRPPATPRTHHVMSDSDSEFDFPVC